MTIAIVSWNTRDLLIGCLKSLESAAAVGNADVWVVDNASRDESAEAVRGGFPWVTLLASPENLGFGSAVNLVAARTRTEWIAPANADLQFSPGALDALLQAGDAHPKAGAIAPRLLLPDGTTQHSAYPFPGVGFAAAYLCGLPQRSRRLARHWCIGPGFDPEEPREIPWAVGAFLMVRRRAWDAAGGFDSNQWMYAEDLDLGWRIRKAGWAIRYEPSAQVVHFESSSTKLAWGDARHARWHASTYAWLLRRRGIVVARLIALINVVGFSLRATVMLGGQAIGQKHAWKKRHEAMAIARTHAVGLRSRRRLMQQGGERTA